MIELLKQFPALWSLVGIIMASGVFWLASRRIFVMQGQANENLVQTLERHNVAITAEKDDYKTKLHDEKGHHQATMLKVKELELRPDMTTLFHNSEQFYSKQTEAMAALIKSIQIHDESVSTRMQPVYDSLQTMGEGIKELLQRARAQRTRDRKKKANEDTIDKG